MYRVRKTCVFVVVYKRFVEGIVVERGFRVFVRLLQGFLRWLVIRVLFVKVLL